MADIQHDCQELSHSVLTTLYGGMAAGTLGLSTVTAACRLCHSACPAPPATSLEALCLPHE